MVQFGNLHSNYENKYDRITIKNNNNTNQEF